ncbi:nuclear transport factor 2 family protein [Parasediminibacterium paludis]|uniref:Nuclear transport factor 2 family protein n=1 Tax=Parasediminibacterium paludis TaxID=908966 RepID=A0ABV8PWZ3_9BACT
MKKILALLAFVVLALASEAQAKADKLIALQVQAFNKAIFIVKDTAVLSQLLATEVTYGHSNGKLETRTEMLKGVMDDTKVYSDVKTEVGTIVFSGKTVAVRHVLSAMQKDTDGKVSLLKLQVLQVWVKEKKAWKLLARQAVKLVA